MIEIRNLMFQPLAFHMVGDEGSIHLGSRERMIIPEEHISDEIRTAVARGFVSLADVSGSTQPDPPVECAVSEHSEAADNGSSEARPRKRRQA